MQNSPEKVQTSGPPIKRWGHRKNEFKMIRNSVCFPAVFRHGSSYTGLALAHLSEEITMSDDLRRAIEFLVEQQAQLAATMQRSEEENARVQSQLAETSLKITELIAIESQRLQEHHVWLLEHDQWLRDHNVRLDGLEAQE